jgi:hypothetical protein
MRLKRGPHRSGMRLIIDIIVAQVPISDLDFTLMIVIRRTFVIMYPDASRTSRRVAVPTKGILGKMCGYTMCFKKNKEVNSHLEVIAR